MFETIINNGSLKDGPPEWYFKTKTPMADLFSNLFFIIPAYSAFKYNYPSLGLSILIAMLCSMWFHSKLTRDALYIDRLGMILAYSVFINILYPGIPIIIFFSVGFILLEISKKVKNQIPYIFFQFLSFGLFAFKESIVYKSRLYILLFVIGNVIQSFDIRYFHTLKHIILSIALNGLLKSLLKI